MLKRLALAIAVACLSLSSAEAHGPSRKKVVETLEIAAPAEKVWAALSNYQDMSWHPRIESVEGKGGNEIEVATRALKFKDAGVVTDKLTKYDAAAKSYSTFTDQIDLKTLPVAGYSSTITVSEADGKSTVEWKGAFYRGYMNNDPPKELNDESAVTAITAFQKDGLAGLKAKVEGGS